MPDPNRYEEFATLMELSTSRVLSYLHAMLLDWNDAEDAFQETCLVLWQKFDEFESGTSFSAWALRIAQHKVMNFQKKHRRHSAMFSATLRDELQTEFEGRDADDAAAGLAALSGCMKKLNQSDHGLVKQSYVEGIPVRQIADAVGRSPESIHHSLRRIRVWLLDCIRRELRRMDQSIHAVGDVLEERQQ